MELPCRTPHFVMCAPAWWRGHSSYIPDGYKETYYRKNCFESVDPSTSTDRWRN